VNGTSRAETAASLPSLRLVLDYAREDYHRQIARGESVVSRSLTLLGFVAVFIGLVAGASFTGTAWRVLAAIGLACLLFAVGLLINVVWMHWYTGAPATEGMVEELYEDEGATRLRVLEDTKVAVEKNEPVLRRVELRYRVGVAFAAAGTFALGIGVIVAIIAGSAGVAK
jgi:hypothetical protein